MTRRLPATCVLAALLMGAMAHAEEPAPSDAPPSSEAPASSDTPPPAAPAPPAPPAAPRELEPPPPPDPSAPVLKDVLIEGSLVDKKDQLVRFLELKPGTRYDDRVARRVRNQLAEVLRYTVVAERLTPTDGGAILALQIEPVRVVRNIRIKGNWPLFDDEIQRHLRVRSGYPIPADEPLERFLAKEAETVKAALARDGFFDAEVKLLPEPTNRPDWINLTVQISLGRYYKLAQLQVEGGKTLGVTSKDLFKFFDKCCFLWGRFRPSELREDARKAEEWLRERGWPAARVTPLFDETKDVDRRRREVKLTVRINERRKVEVEFVGNRAIPDRDLREVLTIFTNGAYDEIELADSAKAVQRAYQQRGFFEAKVSFRKKRVSEGVDKVSFLISEGPELRVRGVEIVPEPGATLSFSSDELRERAGLETKVFPKIGSIGLGQGGYATSVQLAQDEARLDQFYREQGFPDAKARVEVARDPGDFGSLGAIGAEAAGSIQNKNDLWVRFYVKEGKREVVSGLVVHFLGEHARSERDLLAALKTTPGTPFSAQLVAADQQRLTQLYRGLPHPYFRAKFEPEWNEAHDRVVIHVFVREGPACTFGETAVRGNFVTRENVIRQDLPWKEGEPFDARKLEEGERNLQTHGIFSSARVDALADETTWPTKVPIVVRVQERYFEKVQIIPVAGIYSDRLPNYATVALSVLFNNLGGYGSQLEIRGDTGFDKDAWGGSIRYTDLRVFGPKWRLDLFGFVRRELTVRLGPIQSYFGSIGLTRALTPSLRVFGRWDNYLAQIAAPLIRTPGSHDTSIQDNTFISKLTAGIIWDRRVDIDGRPNPLVPDRGWLLQGSAGYSIPFLGNQFVVISGQALGIVPIQVRRARFFIIGNLRADYGIPIGQSALPLVERFFAGGDNATRGYGQDQLKTEIVRSDVSPLSPDAGFRVVPQGGNIRLLTTVEFMFPIAKTFFGLPFRWMGALFWDMGAIANSPELITPGDFKHSIGVSLFRLMTPIGPLSVDYAYPLTQTLAEEQWKTATPFLKFPGRIHFNVGIPVSRL